ncbi:MAG: hypothetical protein J6Y16_04350 [Treponema sp.]|nr:hypothetical protein [Treponema sp.]
MKRLRIIAVVLMVFSIMVASCKKEEEEPSQQELYYDLIRVKADLASSSIRGLYDPAVFDELEKDILDGNVTGTDCYYRIKEIFSGFHVAHVNIGRTGTEKIDNMALPMNFYNFGNEYHISRAVKKYKKYLGWKIVEINGVPINEAIESVAKFRSYETEVAKKYFLEYNIPYNDYKYAGLLDEKGKLRLKLESPDGKTEELKLKFIDVKKANFISFLPEKENECLPHFVKEKYDIKPCPEKRTLYIPINSCLEREDYPASEWFADIVKELDNGSYDTLVFDLRYNPGGTMFTFGLPEKYKDVLEKYNIALVVTGRTFSASTWFMESILTVCPDTKIFGEETGQAIYNYTGVANEELKAMKSKIIFPMYLDELSPLTNLKKRTTEYYRGIMPDVQVFESFEDFSKGEDAIYNAIYDYFN